MKVAITVWEERISPVFDAAQMLLIAEIADYGIVQNSYELFRFNSVSHLIDMVCRCDIRVLICGAISEEYNLILENSGVQLIPFVAGKAKSILQCYVEGKELNQFAMPGCGACLGITKPCCRKNSLKKTDFQ